MNDVHAVITATDLADADLPSLGQAARHGLDAARLRFDASDPAEASAQLLKVFSRHRLELPAQARGFCARFRGDRLGALSVSSLSYGCEAALEIEPARAFVLVSLQLCGHGQVVSPRGRVAGGPGLITIDSSAEAGVHKRYSADSERLNVLIDRSHLDDMLVSLTGRPVRRPLEFAPAMHRGDGTAARWRDGLRLALGYLGDRGPALLTRRIEETLMLMLLSELPHNHADALGLAPPALAPRHVRRAEEHMREHLDQPLTLSAIAQASGVSVRALSEAFRRFRDTSPMRHLRDLRLDAVHALLRQGDERITVADAAGRFGFVQLGRFAAEYQRRFGELPSHTLRHRSH